MRRKNAYLRIERFLIILLLLLGINSFIYNFLSNYYMIAFLIILLVIFKIFFGFEKDRHRYAKDVIMDLVVYLLTFFIIYYLFGLLITFARNNGYYSWYGFSHFTLRLFLYVCLREFFRYQVLNKCEGSKASFILSIIVFIIMDISNNFYFYSFNSKYNIFIFISLYFLPVLGNNLLASYLDTKVGYKPVLFYMLVTTLYTYIMPIIPNPNEYLASVINFCLPMVVLYKQYSFFKKESDEDITRDYNKTNVPLLSFSLILTVFLVYFTSGYFHYHAIAVASGSMFPAIAKGDVVIVEKLDEDINKLKVGDVIAFNYSNTVIVHRLVNIINDRGEYFFYTKGDANNDVDSFVIKKGMIEGKVKVNIPLVGYPTVWLNEL